MSSVWCTGCMSPPISPVAWSSHFSVYVVMIKTRCGRPLSSLLVSGHVEKCVQIKKKKKTASNVPIVAPNVITSLSLTGNRDWVLCIEYEVFI